jgi:hypothetical protein
MHACMHAHLTSFLQQQHHFYQYLGDGSRAIPTFPNIEFPVGFALPEDCTLEDVDILCNIYREHCEVIPVIVFVFI